MSATTYRFGEIEVDLPRMQVRRAGREVLLEPKSFDVLVFLVEHRDRLVTKEELLDHVWHDTFVTPNVLTRAVAQLRKALGDEAREAHIIETAARRGYRFIAPVTEGPEAVPAPAAAPAPSPTPPGQPPRRGVMVPVALAALLFLAIGLLVWLALAPGQAADPPVLASRRLTTRAGYNGQPAISPD